MDDLIDNNMIDDASSAGDSFSDRPQNFPTMSNSLLSISDTKSMISTLLSTSTAWGRLRVRCS